MPESTKTCDHPPNPEWDKNMSGVPYQSCLWCFKEELESAQNLVSQVVDMYRKDGE